VHSHVRRALVAGASGEEIQHSLLLLTSTIGFPTTMAALSWAEEILLLVEKKYRTNSGSTAPKKTQHIPEIGTALSSAKFLVVRQITGIFNRQIFLKGEPKRVRRGIFSRIDVLPNLSYHLKAMSSFH